MEYQLINNNVAGFTIPYGNGDWEKWFLLMSDEHFDSRLCDKRLLKRHHDAAVARDATIMKFGDIFDAMGADHDPRSSKSDIDPNHQRDDYFDAIVESARDFYMPYADRIAFMSMGNHELSVLQRHETNILRRLSNELGHSAMVGFYSWFVQFQFCHEAANGNRSRWQKIVMYYNHGSGGNSPVTKGVLSTARRQHDIIADIYVSGHIHTSFVMDRPRIYLNSSGNVVVEEPAHVQLGTYKMPSVKNSWEDTKEFAPPSMGGKWLRFFKVTGDSGSEIKFEIIRA